MEQASQGRGSLSGRAWPGLGKSLAWDGSLGPVPGYEERVRLLAPCKPASERRAEGLEEKANGRPSSFFSTPSCLRSQIHMLFELSSLRAVMLLYGLLLFSFLACALAEGAPPAPALTWLYTANLTFDTNVTIGQTALGRRGVWPIKGGSFAGPQLNGNASPRTSLVAPPDDKARPTTDTSQCVNRCADVTSSGGGNRHRPLRS